MIIPYSGGRLEPFPVTVRLWFDHYDWYNNNNHWYRWCLIIHGGVYVVAPIQCNHVPKPNIWCRRKAKLIQQLVLLTPLFGYIAATRNASRRCHKSLHVSWSSLELFKTPNTSQGDCSSLIYFWRMPFLFTNGIAMAPFPPPISISRIAWGVAFRL